MDRQAIWRRVERDYSRLKENAPEGFEPAVVVYLHGRPDPVFAHQVETTRDPDDAWVRLESLSSDRGEHDLVHQGDRWIHVHESNIARIEITIRRIEVSIRRADPGDTHVAGGSSGIGFFYTVSGDNEE